jgi:selenocysteine lyase/cysteine desulfurase
VPEADHRAEHPGMGAVRTVTLTDAMTAHLRREGQLGGYEAAAEAQDAVAAAYAAVAELVGGQSEEIALFDNATHAWNAAFYSVRLRPGDQILTGRAEYGSNVLAYWQAAGRAGADVVVVPDDEHGQALDLGLEAIGQRAVALGARLRGQLAELPFVTVHDLGQRRCAIVTARIDGLPAEQAVEALAQAGVNVTATVPEDNPLDTQHRGVHPLIRFSPHYYTTDDEIDRTIELVAALVKLAATQRPSPDIRPVPALTG